MYLLSLRHGDTLTDHRDATWIAGCEHCRRDFVAACQAATSAFAAALRTDVAHGDVARGAIAGGPT